MSLCAWLIALQPCPPFQPPFMFDTGQGFVSLHFTSSLDVPIGWFPILAVADSSTAIIRTSNVATEYIQREGSQHSRVLFGMSAFTL